MTMKEIGIMIAIGIITVLALFNIPLPEAQTINCSLVEISPDFSPEQRKQCREIRATKL
jgi:Tfp pilus assembly major pilin PilA